MKKKKKNSLIFICDQGKSHFAMPILNYLSHYIPLYLAESKHSIIHKIRSYNKKVIWVEWARKQAVFMSNNLKNNQKLIIRLHRFELNDLNTLNQIKWEKVNKVVLVNSEIEKQFNELFPNVETIMIPNAIQVNNFPVAMRSETNSLLAFGTYFSPVKDYNNLIKLFYKLLQLDNTFNLTIAGFKSNNDEYKIYLDSLQNTIKKLNIEKFVTIKLLKYSKNELSSHSNIKELLNNHNGIISFSKIESFHYAFAEGLLSGLQGFCRGWRKLNPYEFWKSWCYSNEKEFIDGILKWGDLSIDDRTLIGNENRKYIIDNFSSDVIGNKYLELFIN